MSHRGHSNKHVLPANAEIIVFPRSDGDPACWPTNMTEEVDSEGCVNYMRPVSLDEPLSIKWRCQTADAIANQLKYPSERPYVLQDYPSGYRMFDHNKGKKEAPRHDVYLFGRTGLRFRSVPEFIPHAIWLMGDAEATCKCKYCSKMSQREVTARHASIMRESVSQSPSPSRPARPKPEKAAPHKASRGLGERFKEEQRIADANVYAGVQKSTPKNHQMSSNIQRDAVMLVDRNNDLRNASRVPSAECLPRWFRDGELVWCALAAPIVGPDGEAIRFWPGIVDEIRLVNRRPAQGIPLEDHTVRQDTAYQVQFLAISRSYSLPDTMIIPYQSYICPNDVLQRMVQRPVNDWCDLVPGMLSNFDPCPPSTASPPTFGDALTPFALALQIASKLSGLWCLTDEWEAKVPVSTGASTSLQSAIEMAGAHNAANRASAPLKIVTQTRFQGLWWGGERIWEGDLIRLKVPRNCLAPAGAQHIFSPAGPGPARKAMIEQRGGNPVEHGANTRGVFMKIESIFLLDGQPGRQRECRVAGMLYELADTDWVDPNLPRLDPSATFIDKGPAPASKTNYPPPLAPNSYKFRPIISSGYESVMSLSLISGRYYPGLMQHPIIKPQVLQVDPLDANSMIALAHLWSLEGLFGGYKNSVDPKAYKNTREKMMADATATAIRELEEHVQDRRDEADLGMDIDID